jgi:hypothetical protein
MSINPFTNQLEIFMFSMTTSLLKNIGNLDREGHQRHEQIANNIIQLKVTSYFVISLSGLSLGFIAGCLVAWFLIT